MADDDACTLKQAERYFSRLRRAEMGIHHYIGCRFEAANFTIWSPA